MFDPFKYQQRVTLTRTILAISVIWIYTFSISYLPPLLGYHHWVNNAECYLANIMMRPVVMNLISNFFVTTLMIYMMYAAMFKVAAGHVKKIMATTIGNSTQETAKVQMHLKAAKTLLFVTGTFSFCWLPYVINLINLFYTDPNDTISVQRQVQKYFSVLLFVNSAVNPIIYARKLPGFRAEFIRILTCYRCNVREDGSVAPSVP